MENVVYYCVVRKPSNLHEDCTDSRFTTLVFFLQYRKGGDNAVPELWLLSGEAYAAAL